MNILLTGAYGQLGNEIRHILVCHKSTLGNVSAIFESANVFYPSHKELDIASKDSVDSLFSEAKFDLVINCAAFTNVDACEDNEAGSLKVNAIGPWYLAQAVEKQHGRLVQVSTDYVFPGTMDEPRCESDPSCPMSAYGRGKLAGEVLCMDACTRVYVVRTAWLYGKIGHNFVRTILRLAKEKRKLSVVDDQLGNPTNAADVAYEILALASTDNFGIYHCTNEGIVSWYEFAKAILDEAGIKCDCEPISSVEYKRRFPASADRPHFSALENKHLADTIGNRMRPWREALTDFISHL